MENRISSSRAIRIVIQALIVLSVAATLFEEVAIVVGSAWRLRSAAAALCLLFDIFFFLQFAARMGKAIVERRIAAYFLDEAGWIDLFAAVFPLVFSSGPFIFDAALGLRTTTAIAAMGNFRLLRGLGLLRSLRLLRFFDRDEAGAVSGKKPLLRAATFALCASLAVLVGAEGASILGLWPDAHEALARKRFVTLTALVRDPSPDSVESIAGVDEDLLLVRSSGSVVFTRYSSEEYRRRFGPDEIGYLRSDGGLEAFFSLSGELRAQAASTLAAATCVLAVLAAIAMAYMGRPSRGPGLPAPARDEVEASPPPSMAGEPATSDELAGLLGEGADGEAL